MTNQQLRRAPLDKVLGLAYGEFANPPVHGADPELASRAYDELERRGPYAGWKNSPTPCPSCGNLYDHRYPCVG